MCNKVLDEERILSTCSMEAAGLPDQRNAKNESLVRGFNLIYAKGSQVMQ